MPVTLSPEAVDAVGYLAALLTTISFVPQVLKTWRSRSAADLSIGMLLTFTAGVFLWLVYGLALDSTPVTVANAVTFALAAVLLVLRVRFGAGR